MEAKIPKVKVPKLPEINVMPMESVAAVANPFQSKFFMGGLFLLIVVISFAIYLIMKRTKKLERESKNAQKINNEVTNLKYGLQDTVNAVRELRQRVPAQTKKRTSRKRVPEPVPKKVHFQPVEPLQAATVNDSSPVSMRMEIESVNSDDVDGESEVIELEEECSGSEEEEVDYELEEEI